MIADAVKFDLYKDRAEPVPNEETLKKIGEISCFQIPKTVGSRVACGDSLYSVGILGSHYIWEVGSNILRVWVCLKTESSSFTSRCLSTSWKI